MINKILKDNWNGSTFGIKLDKLLGYTTMYEGYDPYFFLRKELTVTHDTWHAAKERGDIRHCKIYRGRFLDYVVRKEFDSFEDWMKDAGARSLDDIAYGVNRVHKIRFNHQTRVQEPGHAHWVPVQTLLTRLGYIEPPHVEIPETPDLEMEELTELMNTKLAITGLSVDNVWIIEKGTPVRWVDYFNM